MAQRSEYLIIFDCDGTLVDSESLATDLLLKELLALNIPITREIIDQEFVGKSTKKNIEFIEQHYDVRLPEGVEAEWRSKMHQKFLTELQPIPGIEKVLRHLRFNSCVASNGPRNQIISSLTVTKLMSHFTDDTIFSAHDIQRWKPSPDLFLWAAESCGYDAQRCIVIEDSAVGYEAAISAQMQVVFHRPAHIGHSLEIQAENEINVMEDLLPLLDQLT